MAAPACAVATGEVDGSKLGEIEGSALGALVRQEKA